MHDPTRIGPRLLLVLALALLFPGAAPAGADERFPKPESVAKRVEFWKRVYSEAETNSGYLHDAKDLSIVYEKIHVGKVSPRVRERKVKPARSRYKKILTKLGKGVRTGLSKEEQRVLDLFPPGTSNATFRASAQRVRFQLGQADRFREGLVRMGRWEPYIRDVLREHNLPEELIAIPHVESSYNPNALSHAGASGIWQFTRSTGRQFMRVNHYIDERRDPFLATVAAARLLKRNYEITKSWPLAITAYNHGAAGMRRAAKRLGTRNIGTITEKYTSRTFGFASRNFYASFLAALEIEKNPERYFPSVSGSSAEPRQVVALDAYYQVSSLSQALGTPVDVLKQLNPALLKPIWSGQKHVPKGYLLRVPTSIDPAPKIAALPSSVRYAKQVRDRYYRVRRGDTLSTIARRFGVSQRSLVRANSLRSKHRIRVGQRLEIPGRAGAPVDVPVLAKAPGAKLAQVGPTTYRVRRGDNLAIIAKRHGVTIGAIQRENKLRNRNRIHAGQVLRIPGHTAAPRPQPAPAERPDVYVVRRGDSLHHIARRFGVTIAELVEWNGIGRRRIIHPGQRLKLRPEGKSGSVATAAEATAQTSQPAETTARNEAATAEPDGAEEATSEELTLPADPSMPTLDTSTGRSGASTPTLSGEPVTPAPRPSWGQPPDSAPTALGQPPDSAPTALGQPPDSAPNAATRTPTEPLLVDSPEAVDHAFEAAFPASPDPALSGDAPATTPLLSITESGTLPRDRGRYRVLDGHVRVQPEETLGHYADWLGVSATRLRRLNGMPPGRTLQLGQSVRLDLSRVDANAFEARRLAHHRALQEAFFSAFTVSGTEVRVLKKGETLWQISRQGGGIPVWLLQAHNPQVDLGSLRAGERLHIPRVAPAGS